MCHADRNNMNQGMTLVIPKFGALSLMCVLNTVNIIQFDFHNTYGNDEWAIKERSPVEHTLTPCLINDVMKVGWFPPLQATMYMLFHIHIYAGHMIKISLQNDKYNS